MDSDPWYAWRGEELLIRVRVHTRARQDAVRGVHAGRLQISVCAPPLEGRANHRLLRYLAGLFRTGPSRLSIDRGSRGRDKTVSIAGLDRDTFRLPAELSELA